MACGFESHSRHQSINSSMKKILLFTVPRTGTHFTRGYIHDVLKVPPTQGMAAYRTDRRQIYGKAHTHTSFSLKRRHLDLDVKLTMEYIEKQCNVIIPIRDPIENAISGFRRGRETLDYAVRNWEIMFECYPRMKNVFWIDVWAPKENRYNMMLKLNEFVDIEPEQELLDNFVLKWEKKNASDNVFVDLEKHDFSRLQFAVDWYNEKKAELNKLYTPGEGSQTGLLIQSL